MHKIGGAGVLAVLLCAGLLSSCELLDGSGGDGASYPPLEATEWILARLNGRSLIAQTNITLDFDDETLDGVFDGSVLR